MTPWRLSGNAPINFVVVKVKEGFIACLPNVCSFSTLAFLSDTAPLRRQRELLAYRIAQRDASPLDRRQKYHQTSARRVLSYRLDTNPAA